MTVIKVSETTVLYIWGVKYVNWANLISAKKYSLHSQVKHPNKQRDRNGIKVFSLPQKY